MLYIINENQTSKFPQDEYDYTDPSNPILIKQAEFTFKRLSQDIRNNISCGEIIGDLQLFLSSGIEYQEVTEIPTNFNQICLPQEAGRYLTYEQIKAWRSLAETNVDNVKKDDYLLDLDYRVSMMELGV